MVAKCRAGARLGGVRQGLGQGKRLAQALQSLVRIAEHPEGQGRYHAATHAGVMPAVEPCVRVVLLGIVERSPLLEVGSGSGQLAAPQQGRPQRVVGFQEERSVVDLLGQAQEPLPQRPRPLVLCAVVIKSPESPQHWKTLWRLPHLLAQLLRPGVCLCHSRRGRTPNDP
jgi:hypothetical protein